MPEVIDIHVHGTRDWIGVSTRVYNSTSSHIVLLGQDAAMPRERRLESQTSLHCHCHCHCHFNVIVIVVLRKR